MVWQIFVLGFLVLETAAYLLRRHLAVSLASHNRLVHGFYFLCVQYPAGLLFALVTQAQLNIGWVNILLLLAGGALFPLFCLLAYRASKTVDAGLFTILFNLTPVVTIIAATLLLHERLSGQQLLGAAIIISSAFIATLPRVLNRSVTKTAGIGIALAGIALVGLAIVYERWMLTRMDIGAYLVFGWGAQTLWMILIAWPERKYVAVLRQKKNFRPVLAFALAASLKSILFIAALKFSGSASLVIVFASFATVLVVLAAYFFLKEKDHLWYKVSAAAVGVVGLIILNI